MTFLILTTIALFVIAIVRLMNVYDLSAEIRGGRTDDRATEGESRNMAWLWALFVVWLLGFLAWQFFEYKDDLLPRAASAHGPAIDNLFNTTMVIITLVFALTHIVLAYQIVKNYFRNGRKATYFAHSNKLELIWTVVPAAVLTGLIVYGLTVWDDVIYPKAEDPIVVELYSKQFDWTARYAGKDKVLGKSDYRKIDAGNDLGLLNVPEANDDIIVKGEMHLVKDKPVLFKFRSRDVIHSAYLPHFRVQMNTVPGMETAFEFTPTITTEEMRKETGNEKFNYVILCNKICGTSHYNMQMDVIVETQEEYDKWMREQQTWRQKKATASAESIIQ
ncbi:MAG: cytochrome c oxidase subunit II [Bacteroidia bacterium]|nr:cytochrome c oxidase subunit II [Bacteroidia bacterium]MCC6767632.1 cytochrome c oxidase subunit II [Bacteroidia bacterium]